LEFLHSANKENFEFLNFDVNGSKYLELRTLDTESAGISLEEGFNASEFEKYGYSTPIRLEIPGIDSCEVPVSEDTIDFSEFSPTDWAMYSVAGLSGVLALNVISNKLKGRKKEDDLGKWDAADTFFEE